jgi:hypothetical protein
VIAVQHEIFGGVIVVFIAHYLAGDTAGAKASLVSYARTEGNFDFARAHREPHGDESGQWRQAAVLATFAIA